MHCHLHFFVSVLRYDLTKHMMLLSIDNEIAVEKVRVYNIMGDFLRSFIENVSLHEVKII